MIVAAQGKRDRAHSRKLAKALTLKKAAEGLLGPAQSPGKRSGGDSTGTSPGTRSTKGHGNFPPPINVEDDGGDTLSLQGQVSPHEGSLQRRGTPLWGSRRKIDRTLTKSEKIFLFLNDPLSGTGAWLWAMLILILIVVSCVTFVLESQPSLCCGRYDWLWDPIEALCIAFFTVEYVGRVLFLPEYWPADEPPSVSQRNRLGSDPDLSGLAGLEADKHLIDDVTSSNEAEGGGDGANGQSTDTPRDEIQNQGGESQPAGISQDKNGIVVSVGHKAGNATGSPGVAAQHQRGVPPILVADSSSSPDENQQPAEQPRGSYWDAFMRRTRFALTFLNFVDLVAIFPYYLELIAKAAGLSAGDLSLLRIFRLVRVFRLLKIGKYSEGLQLLGNTMRRSARNLLLLCFFLSIAVILLSAAVYYAERGKWCDEQNNFCSGTGEEFGVGWYAEPNSFPGATYTVGCSTANWCRQKSQFDSFFVAGYWCVMTMTTTGYGDPLVPRTVLGRLVGCVTMLMGLVLLALPITVISENFAQEYQTVELAKLSRMEEEKRQREAEEAAGASRSSRTISFHGFLGRKWSNSREGSREVSRAGSPTQEHETGSSKSKWGLGDFLRHHTHHARSPERRKSEGEEFGISKQPTGADSSEPMTDVGDIRRDSSGITVAAAASGPGSQAEAAPGTMFRTASSSSSANKAAGTVIVATQRALPLPEPEAAAKVLVSQALGADYPLEEKRPSLSSTYSDFRPASDSREGPRGISRSSSAVSNAAGSLSPGLSAAAKAIGDIQADKKLSIESSVGSDARIAVNLKKDLRKMLKEHRNAVMQDLEEYLVASTELIVRVILKERERRAAKEQEAHR